MMKKFNLIIIILFSLLIIVMTFVLTFTPLKIAQLEGISMSGVDEKLELHLAFVSDKLDLKRNDVIIFDPAKADISEKLSHYRKINTLNGETFTKRILAVEGETIAIIDNQLLINDEPVFQDMAINGFVGKNMDKIIIPKDHYFVAGDYRYDSLDSRYFGPIAKKSIIGEVLTFDDPILRKISNILNNQISNK